jgi:di/tricarboxylate transporter
MSTELALVLGLLVSAVVMFVINKPRMDIVALLMLTLLPFTGVITMGEALAGFSDSNIVLIAALFVIGEGLVRTGVARNMGDLLIKTTGTSEVRLLVFLMIAVCGLGSMMSSTAVTAIFIPVALRIAQTTGTAPGRLMMPLCYAALISGMTTLVATAPNLVVNSELIRQGELVGKSWEFGFFSFTPFGVPILIVAIVYMLFTRRWLGKEKPAQNAAASESRRRPSLAGWIEAYDLKSREHRLRVLSSSSLVGKSLGDADLTRAASANVIAIERIAKSGSVLIEPTDSTQIEAGDVLLVHLFEPTARVETLRDQFSLESLTLPGTFFSDRAQEIGMAEVIVPPDSELVGKTVLEAKFRTRTSLTVLGLRHGSDAPEANALEANIKGGDTLLVVGPWKDIERLTPERSGVLIMRLPIDIEDVLPVSGRAVHAVVCLLIVVGLMVSGIVPNVQAALIGCLLMGATGCIDIVSAYKSINWKTLILIVGMLPFSLALQRTGGVDLAADGLMAVTSGADPRVILACIFIITAALGLFISNTATAVLMAPVALAVANDLGASPFPFAMIVALAASTAFMTPISSPVCTLVVGPGGYKFGDFVKVGTPLAFLVLIISVTMVPWLMPLHPDGTQYQTPQQDAPATQTAPEGVTNP